MKKINIAIDGYSSCGKSTLARQLAKKLSYLYIDSGAMYRALTLYFIRENINWNRPDEVVAVLKSVKLVFLLNDDTGKNDIFLNDENVEEAIREMLVAEKVSEVAAVKKVRDFAVSLQQEMGKNKGVVMDGRDIGTVVFSNAALKIFMTADMTVRVERRFAELYNKNKNITIEEVKDNLAMRDYIDANRTISPLRQAPDAFVLDNSNLSQDKQLKIALKKAQQIINH